MKGLFIKDLQLLKTQKNFIFVIVAIAIFLLFINQSTSGIISYLTLVFSLLMISTISYDELDNSMAYLMTLPTSRRLYVKEKYVLGLCTGLIGWVLGVIISCAYTLYNSMHMEWLPWIGSSGLIVVILIILLSFTLPTQLKFGGDKGRIALFGVVAVVFMIGYLLVQILTSIGIDVILIFNSLFSLNMYSLLAALFIGSLICMYISYLISLKIMKDKVF